MNNFALVLERQRRHKETEILHTQGLAITEKLFGPEHPNTLISMENVALVLSRKDQYTEAEAMYQQILDKSKKNTRTYPLLYPGRHEQQGKNPSTTGKIHRSRDNTPVSS